MVDLIPYFGWSTAVSTIYFSSPSDTVTSCSPTNTLSGHIQCAAVNTVLFPISAPPHFLVNTSQGLEFLTISLASGPPERLEGSSFNVEFSY